MVVRKKKDKIVEFSVVERGEFEACLLGMTGIILNRVSQKAQRELLFPSGRKSAAQRQSAPKHVPYDEFQQSPYTCKDPNGPTRLQVVAASVKLATASIPLDLPDTGSSKSQLQRLLYAPQDRIPLWGIPEMKMDVVRNSDMNRTPDIRTRMIVPRWATKVTLSYVKPVLRHDVVVRFLQAAGFMRGIGDWRPEKGSGNYGTFEVVSPDDERFISIVENGGREAQLAAIETPDFYDDETCELYRWWHEEYDRRGFDKKQLAEAKANGKSKTKASKKSKTKAKAKVAKKSKSKKSKSKSERSCRKRLSKKSKSKANGIRPTA